MKALKYFILTIMIIPLLAPSTFAQAKMGAKDEGTVKKAICQLYPTEGNTAQGTVIFEQVPGGIKVTADITGLKPGKHGFHIHEYGDCSAPNGTSAGGHFNPDHVKHGGPSDKVRHVGDMGNVVADAAGHAHLEYIDNMLSFSGPHNIIGHGIIVHAGADDYVTQPTGNAGPRVACGVIGIAGGK
jgi:superoxide dismutase, Cu-Zn family